MEEALFDAEQILLEVFDRSVNLHQTLLALLAARRDNLRRRSSSVPLVGSVSAPLGLELGWKVISVGLVLRFKLLGEMAVVIDFVLLVGKAVFIM